MEQTQATIEDGGNSPLQEMAISKLSRALGKEKAVLSLKEALRAAGLSTIASVQDLLDVAVLFIQKGGFLEIVGRSLKVYAILRGATE